MTAMPTRPLAGRRVGAVGLGCMGMSWAYTPAAQDERRSLEVIARAVALGVTLLDTADAYGPFTNELLVGRALAALGERRRDVVVATKCGLVIEDGATHVYGRDGRPQHIADACEASLGRLGVERIDLYYLHRVDPAVPIEESWGALAELVRAGKVAAIGLSEVGCDELERAHAIHPVAALQSELSLWTRDPLENGTLAWCAAHGAAFVPFCPLGRGYLTGTVAAGSFGEDDFRARNPRFTDEAMRANQAIVERVRAVASRLDATPAQVAIAWTLRQGGHVVPIPGTKRLRYLDENAAAASLELGPDDLAALDALPPASGARYGATAASRASTSPRTA